MVKRDPVNDVLRVFVGETLPKMQILKSESVFRRFVGNVRERLSIKAAEILLTPPCRECNPPGTVNRFGAKICRRCHL